MLKVKDKKKKNKNLLACVDICVDMCMYPSILFNVSFIYVPRIHTSYSQNAIYFDYLHSSHLHFFQTSFIHLSILSPNPKSNPTTQKCFLCTYLLSQSSRRKKKITCQQVKSGKCPNQRKTSSGSFLSNESFLFF